MTAHSKYNKVDRDSICPGTNAGHIPTTFEEVIEGHHVKIHTVCRNCRAHIK